MMKWDKLLSQRRIGDKSSGGSSNKSDYDKRTPFEADVDRVVFSSSFRRLGRKTQVHPLPKNDNIHTRLTHSIEVSQVGMSLGKTLYDRISHELPDEVQGCDIGTIIRAACAAHDIGNPPFGHAGESAISHWFDEHCTTTLGISDPGTITDLSRFDGNAQGFRLLTKIENHMYEGGMRLTAATLGAYMKYPYTASDSATAVKCGVFATEKDTLNELAEELGLVQQNNRWSRHPLSYLTEAADDICYATIDLEDAYELGVITGERVYEVFKHILDPTKSNDEVKQRIIDGRISEYRGDVYDQLVSSAISSFMNNYEKIMSGSYNGDLWSGLADGDSGAKVIKEAKELGKTDIYIERNKTEIELGCYSLYDRLLALFCSAVTRRGGGASRNGTVNKLEPRKKNYRMQRRALGESATKRALVERLLGHNSPKYAKIITNDNVDYAHECYRKVVDHVSGMTDNYAHDIAMRMGGIIL